MDLLARFHDAGAACWDVLHGCQGQDKGCSECVTPEVSTASPLNPQAPFAYANSKTVNKSRAVSGGAEKERRVHVPGPHFPPRRTRKHRNEDTAEVACATSNSPRLLSQTWFPCYLAAAMLHKRAVLL
jgi:hypothetical protein